MDMKLDRRRLAAMDKTLLRRGSSFEAEVALYAGPAGPFVVKDCTPMAGWVRLLFGRRVKRREMRIYERLRGVPGVPAYLGAIDEDSFAIEYIEGRTMARQLEKELLEKAMAGLDEVIAALHARRVVHLDLKQKRNVIVRPDGSVAVIDFESAFRVPEGMIGDIILSFLERRDRAGLLKFKAKYAPHLLDPAEQRIAGREKILGFLWPFKRLSRAVRRLRGGA